MKSKQKLKYSKSKIVKKKPLKKVCDDLLRELCSPGSSYSREAKLLSSLSFRKLYCFNDRGA